MFQKLFEHTKRMQDKAIGVIRDPNASLDEKKDANIILSSELQRETVQSICFL